MSTFAQASIVEGPFGPVLYYSPDTAPRPVHEIARDLLNADLSRGMNTSPGIAVHYSDAPHAGSVVITFNDAMEAAVHASFQREPQHCTLSEAVEECQRRFEFSQSHTSE